MRGFRIFDHTEKVGEALGSVRPRRERGLTGVRNKAKIQESFYGGVAGQRWGGLRPPRS